jgi:Flp pilus assembly protein TadB
VVRDDGDRVALVIVRLVILAAAYAFIFWPSRRRNTATGRPDTRTAKPHNVAKNDVATRRAEAQGDVRVNSWRKEAGRC